MYKMCGVPVVIILDPVFYQRFISSTMSRFYQYKSVWENIKIFKKFMSYCVVLAHLTPILLLLSSSTSTEIFYNTEKAIMIFQANSPNTINNDQNIFTN